MLKSRFPSVVKAGLGSSCIFVGTSGEKKFARSDCSVERKLKDDGGMLERR